MHVKLRESRRPTIESELNEYGRSGRVLAPVIGRYGGASSDLCLILDLVAREMARKHTAFYNIDFSEAKALFRQKLARKWGHAIARGWATLLLGRLRDFVVVPSSAGGNSDRTGKFPGNFPVGVWYTSTRVAFRRQFGLLSCAVCPPSLTLVSGVLPH